MEKIKTCCLWSWLFATRLISRSYQACWRKRLCMFSGKKVWFMYQYLISLVLFMCLCIIQHLWPSRGALEILWEQDVCSWRCALGNDVQLCRNGVQLTCALSTSSLPGRAPQPNKSSCFSKDHQGIELLKEALKGPSEYTREFDAFCQVSSCSDHRKIRSARLGWRWPTAQQAGWRPIRCSGGPGCPPFWPPVWWVLLFVPAGFDAFGDVLQPLNSGGALHGPGMTKAEEPKLLASDLDTSLASLASNLSVNSPANQVKKWGCWGVGRFVCVCVKYGWFVCVCVKYGWFVCVCVLSMDDLCVCVCVSMDDLCVCVCVC